MTATLLDREGATHTGVDRTAIESRLSSGEFFWLDFEGTEHETQPEPTVPTEDGHDRVRVIEAA